MKQQNTIKCINKRKNYKLISLISKQEAIEEMDKFLNKLIAKNGTTNI